MEDNIWTKEFWVAAGNRALRTFCQAAVGAIGTALVMSEVNWIAVGSSALLAAIISILMSVATGLPEVKNDK